jgi:hypothetical protein
MNYLAFDIRKRLPDRVSWLIEVVGECWLWRGYLDLDGYGRCRHEGRTWMAHRLVWTVLRGPIPEGQTLDHWRVTVGLPCSRPCVNPAHLRVVPHHVNASRRPPAPKPKGQLRLFV